MLGNMDGPSFIAATVGRVKTQTNSVYPWAIQFVAECTPRLGSDFDPLSCGIQLEQINNTLSEGHF